MGRIIIIDPDKKPNNEYTLRFTNYTIEELILAFNTDQPKNGWVGARGRFLGALRQAFLNTEIDCSSFISEDGMSTSFQIKIEENTIFQINPDQ